MEPIVKFKGLGYISLYIEDLNKAVSFYDKVFGPHDYEETDIVYGWKIGSTWLTVFPASAGSAKTGNPRGIEFAVHVSESTSVDVLYDKLLQNGATSCMKAQDTKMYENMRFACVDDPFGIRIDIYCPL